MKQGAERATVDNEPGDEGAELCGSKEVHLKHGHGMWSNGSVPELVDA